MKQFEYFSEKVLEECATITGEYFFKSVGGCTFQEDNYYEDNRVRVMRLSHSMTIGLFVGSYGENYHFVFERLFDQKYHTKIIVSISLVFGFGAQWKKPSDILIQWANLIGAEPIDFGRKPFILTYAVLIPMVFLPLIALLVFVLIVFFHFINI